MTGTATAATAPSPASTLDDVLAAAAGAARPTGRSACTVRAGWLRAVADALDASAAELVPVAEAETHLPELRLAGEVQHFPGPADRRPPRRRRPHDGEHRPR